VDQTNYQLGFASGDNRTAHGGDSGTAGINGAVNFPIVSYLGAMVSGTYSRTRLSPYFSSQGTALGKSDCGYKDRAVAAGLFVRDPAYGRLGVSDQVGQLTASCGTIFPATDSRRLNTRTVSADGEYYFSRLTLSVARSRTELEGGTRIEAATYGAGLYPSRALELALSAGGLDDRDTYSIAAIYQPEFLEDSASAFIRFTEQRRPNDSHFIYVGFEYYFGTRVDLLTRDRQYR
jgi:hypothetical protein